MKITINEKNKNPLLGRTEVSGVIDYEGATPSNVQLVEHLAKEFKVDSSQVVVKNIYTKFSQQMAEFSAFVYDHQEAKDKAERVTKHMKKRAGELAKKLEEAKNAEAEKKAAEEEAKKAAKEAEAEKAEETPAETKEGEQ